tara:strand:- start:323 stop:574 length:252 start_codon:yes stop_codon:yes gene_type:complete
MKTRLSKSLQRLKKEKLVAEENQRGPKNLNPLEIQIFKSLSEKYDLSLSVTPDNSEKFNNEIELSDEAKLTLDRIRKGEQFKV